MAATTGLAARIRAIIADTFGVDEEELPEPASQSTVSQWSSLNHVMLLAALEERFSARFSMREMATMTSVDEIIKALERHGAPALAR